MASLVLKPLLPNLDIIPDLSKCCFILSQKHALNQAVWYFLAKEVIRCEDQLRDGSDGTLALPFTPKDDALV